MDIDGELSFLEKSLHNLSKDIEHDDETYITSQLAKKQNVLVYTTTKQRIFHLIPILSKTQDGNEFSFPYMSE